VREAEEAVRLHGQPDGEAEAPIAESPVVAPEAPPKRLRPPGLLELEELLADLLSTRVAVTMAGTNGTGKITIEFSGLEDLERIYSAMAEGPATDA
jgi:ParB family chromosome partitioning protein